MSNLRYSVEKENEEPILTNKYSLSVCWLRRDLRLKDHHALSEALKQSQKVRLVFVFDSFLIKSLSPLATRDQAQLDRRLSFIAEGLEQIDTSLSKWGGQLDLYYGCPKEIIPNIMRTSKAQALFLNRDYEPYATQRDSEVIANCQKLGTDIHTYKDHVVFEKHEIRKTDGGAYQIFTPYKNRWLEIFSKNGGDEGLKSYQTAQLKDKIDTTSSKRSATATKWLSRQTGMEINTPPLPGGEVHARKRLKAFTSNAMAKYHRDRDYPAIDGTSQLSPYLRHGMISIRQLVNAATKEKTQGSDVWLSELVWREFYQMIVSEFPHVAVGPFKKEYNKIKWQGQRDVFRKWQQGQTGFPLVDAAMRCLRDTGMMHNRLRMVVASFLCKTLLVNWRWGESHFAQYLFDYDLAANNGGWQWSSSSGCDAQPYFRIFNPYTQSQKFDPQGEFIRRYCPELKDFTNKLIHDPSQADMLEQSAANCQIGRDYPFPIVDYRTNRQKALEMYSVVKKID